MVPGARPIYQRPYPVPFQKQEQFNKELNSMIADGVFRSVGESKWGFPSFTVPKKDGQVRWLSDFRKLNTPTVRKPHPPPKTQDIMLKRGKHTCFTDQPLRDVLLLHAVTKKPRDLRDLN